MSEADARCQIVPLNAPSESVQFFGEVSATAINSLISVEKVVKVDEHLYSLHYFGGYFGGSPMSYVPPLKEVLDSSDG